MLCCIYPAFGLNFLFSAHSFWECITFSIILSKGVLWQKIAISEQRQWSKKQTWKNKLLENSFFFNACVKENNLCPNWSHSNRWNQYEHYHSTAVVAGNVLNLLPAKPVRYVEVKTWIRVHEFPYFPEVVEILTKWLGLGLSGTISKPSTSRLMFKFWVFFRFKRNNNNTRFL